MRHVRHSERERLWLAVAAAVRAGRLRPRDARYILHIYRLSGYTAAAGLIEG